VQTPSPSIGVVIPTHQGRPSVRDALQSVLSQSHAEFEVIVVCDGDGATSRALLGNIRDPRVTILELPKRGVSAARNAGVAALKTEWVTFLDDDDLARPDWLSQWVSAIDAGVEAVTGVLAYWSGNVVDEVSQCHLSLTDPTMKASRIVSGGFALRRDLFLKVGGYDETLAYSENWDIGLRLVDQLRAGQGGQVAEVTGIGVDTRRHPARARLVRYGTAPADAARLFLSRYATRLKGDPETKASLLRIIARSERLSGDYRAAIEHSYSAVRLQPWRWSNTRALAVALLTSVRGIARTRNRTAHSVVNSEPGRRS